MVQKGEWFGEKKTAFLIAERFFNIWYLMRASRRVRNKLRWFAKFLESWFDSEELNARARQFLDRDPDSVGRERYTDLAFAYSEAVPDRYLRRSLASAGLQSALDDLSHVIDFSDLSPELLDRKAQMEKLRWLKARVCSLSIDWQGTDPVEFWRVLGGCPQLSLAEKELIVEHLPKLESAARQEIYGGLRRIENSLLDFYPSNASAVSRLYEAMAAGDIADAFHSSH